MPHRSTRISVLATGVMALLAAACQAQPNVPAPDPQPVPTLPEEACGAAGLQGLVGQPLAAVTLPAYEPQRVYAANDMVTMDFSPQRRNIVLSVDRTTIVEIRCG